MISCWRKLKVFSWEQNENINKLTRNPMIKSWSQIWRNSTMVCSDTSFTFEKKMFNETWWYIYNRWQSNVYTCQVQSTFYRYFIVLTSYMFSGLFQVQWWWFWPEEVGQWCIKVRTKSQHPCHEASALNAGKLLSYLVVRHNT